MCGITGFFSSNKKISEADLQGMTDCISHRGPDAAGYFFSDTKHVGLGHRRLSIIDLSTASDQPMISHSGRYAMIFNGEVYNFKEIAAQLKITPRTTGDSEIILEAFEKLGVDCVHLLNGMFAIVIYDKQEDKAYLFRDRLGVKPLYYFSFQNTFAFASEIKALLKSHYIKANTPVNKKAIATFLYAGYVPGPHTIYTNIHRLPSGSYAIIDKNGMQIHSYWQPEEKVQPAVKTDFTSAKKELKELLTSSVQYRLISDVPFGTFLSGGIDSSLVSAIAQKVSSTPINTFSIGFKEAKFNESEYAKKVSSHLGTHHHEFTVTEKDAQELVERMMDAYDEPYADASALPTMLVSKLARKHVTMTLTGDGGDELFMGYGAYNWAQRLDNPLVKMFRGPLAFALSLAGPRYKRGARVINYSSEQHLKSHIFSQEQYFFSQAELDRLLKTEFDSPLLFNEQLNTRRKLSAAEEQALFDLKYYLKDDLLIKVDVASMQYSLEARTPFLDYRVVEFALNLSEDLKKKNGTAKYLLKEVLYDYVPRGFFDRPKWGFSIPLAKWLKTDLHFLIDKYLNSVVIEKYGVVNYAVVKELVTRFDKGEEGLYNRIWALLLLHRWMSETRP